MDFSRKDIEEAASTLIGIQKPALIGSLEIMQFVAGHGDLLLQSRDRFSVRDLTSPFQVFQPAI